MKKIVTCFLLALCSISYPVTAVAKAKTNADARAARKIAKQQQKELNKYYKEQQKIRRKQEKALKQAQKEQKNKLKDLHAGH